MSEEKIQNTINEQGKDYIAGLRKTIRQLWEKMCEEDGISPDNKFVVFSNGNKYKPFYDKALQQLWEAETQYNAGYIGLKTGGE